MQKKTEVPYTLPSSTTRLTMFSTFSVLAVAFAGLTALSNVAAVPASGPAKVYPEVVPGPGLPTLAELGLTSEQLYTTNSTQSIGKLGTGLVLHDVHLLMPPIELREAIARSADYTSMCYTYTTGSVDNVIACFNYLVNIGTHACGVGPGSVQFCYAGDAQVTGTNIYGYPSVSSSW